MARRLPQRARLALSTVGRVAAGSLTVPAPPRTASPACAASWEHLGLPSVL